VVVAVAAVMFLYGAAMNRGGTRDLSASRGRRYGRGYYYGCTVLKSGVFATASVLSAVATGCAIAAYVYFQRTDEPAPGQFVAPGVAMGQPQWAQPYPPPPYPPPMGYGLPCSSPVRARRLRPQATCGHSLSSMHRQFRSVELRGVTISRSWFPPFVLFFCPY
jgi:hypothetical protein